MVHKNQINGLDRISMWEIGQIIKNMDLEYNIIQMEINIKVVGNRIKDMDKVLTGYLIPKIN